MLCMPTPSFCVRLEGGVHWFLVWAWDGEIEVSACLKISGSGSACYLKGKCRAWALACSCDALHGCRGCLLIRLPRLVAAGAGRLWGGSHLGIRNCQVAVRKHFCCSHTCRESETNCFDGCHCHDFEWSACTAVCTSDSWDPSQCTQYIRRVAAGGLVGVYVTFHR